MKKLLLLIVLLLAGSTAAIAQTGGTAKRVYTGAGGPGTTPCLKGPIWTDIWLNIATGQLSYCSTGGSPGTWSVVGAGGAGAFTSITDSGTFIQTSNAASAFASGPNGDTNPVFRLVNNTASQADGVSITGGAAGNGTTFTALSSGATAGFTFTPKGSPTANFLISTGRLQLAGTSNTTPALRNTGAALDVVLGDASAYTAIKAASFSTAGTGKWQSAGSDGVLLVTNEAGTAGTGWINQGGRCFLTADQTNATTTFANVTGCSVSVTSGRKYVLRAVFLLADSTAADGVKLDFNGGAATVTNFRVHCELVNDTGANAALAAAASTTLAGVINATATTTVNQHEFKCEGTFEPSSTSTFIPRMAQNAHTTGTLTLFRGSHLLMEDMP